MLTSIPDDLRQGSARDQQGAEADYDFERGQQIAQKRGVRLSDSARNAALRDELERKRGSEISQDGLAELKIKKLNMVQ